MPQQPQMKPEPSSSPHHFSTNSDGSSCNATTSPPASPSSTITTLSIGSQNNSHSLPEEDENVTAAANSSTDARHQFSNSHHRDDHEPFESSPLHRYGASTTGLRKPGHPKRNSFLMMESSVREEEKDSKSKTNGEENRKRRGPLAKHLEEDAHQSNNLADSLQEEDQWEVSTDEEEEALLHNYNQQSGSQSVSSSPPLQHSPSHYLHQHLSFQPESSKPNYTDEIEKNNERIDALRDSLGRKRSSLSSRTKSGNRYKKALNIDVDAIPPLPSPTLYSDHDTQLSTLESSPHSLQQNHLKGAASNRRFSVQDLHQATSTLQSKYGGGLPLNLSLIAQKLQQGDNAWKKKQNISRASISKTGAKRRQSDFVVHPYRYAKGASSPGRNKNKTRRNSMRNITLHRKHASPNSPRSGTSSQSPKRPHYMEGGINSGKNISTTSNDSSKSKQQSTSTRQRPRRRRNSMMLLNNGEASGDNTGSTSPSSTGTSPISQKPRYQSSNRKDSITSAERTKPLKQLQKKSHLAKDSKALPSK